MVAIILIVAFGSLVIITSLTIEPLAVLIRKFLGKPGPVGKWDNDELLGLPRSLDGSLLKSPTFQKNSSHRPAFRRRPHSEAIELKSLAPEPNKHRISSQALPPEDLAFSIFDDQRTSFDTSHKTGCDPPPRSSKDQWDECRHNLDSAMPQRPINILDRENERRVPRPIPLPRPPLIVRHFVANGTRNTASWI